MTNVTSAISAVEGLAGLKDKFRRIDDTLASLRTRQESTPVVEEIVTRMRRDVRVDTGRLKAGITASFGANGWTIQATAQTLKSAASGKLGADYAPFIEFGTGPSTRGQSVVTGRVKKRRRRAQRTHPGHPAYPFFYDNAKTVFAEYVLKQEQKKNSLVNEFNA